MIFESFPRLENDRLILKKMTLEDLPGLNEMLGTEEVYRYEPTFLPELLAKSSRDLVERDCDRLFQEKSAILLGIYQKDPPEEFLGLGELYGYSEERSKISLGYRLRKAYWGRGIATSAAGLLKDYILKDLKLQRITAHVRMENPASEKCLVKNGFVKRRAPHLEDWGYSQPVMANKFVIYPEGDKIEE